MNDLYHLRAELFLDYEINKEQIAKIDSALTDLGVEGISYDELRHKLGHSVTPLVDTVSTNYTQWDSLRVIYTYRGTHYEVQIITGKRINDNTSSGLWRTADLDDVEAPSINAGGVHLFESLVEGAVTSLVDSVASGSPFIGAALAVGSTFFDAFCPYMGITDHNTIVYDVLCSYFVSMSSNERYVFVKNKDSADSNQILGYAGNSVMCTITCTYATGKTDQNGFPINYTSTTHELVQSAYYDNCRSKAAEQFWYYNQGIQPPEDEYYSIGHMQIKCFVNSNSGNAATTKIVSLPFEGMTFFP